MKNEMDILLGFCCLNFLLYFLVDNKKMSTETSETIPLISKHETRAGNAI